MTVRAGAGLATLLTATHFAIDAVSGMLAALLPTLQERFLLDEGALALLVASMWFANSMTQPLFGMISDRLDPRLVAALGAVATAALVSLIGVAPSVVAVFVLLLIGGLGSGAFHPAATSLIRTGGLRNPGLAVSLMGAGGTAGLAAGPVVVLLVVSAWGLGATPWLMAPGVALGALLLVSRRRAVARSPAAFRPRHLPKLLAGPVGLLTVAAVLSAIPSITFTSAIPLWLVNERGVASDAALLGWTLAAYNVAAAAGGIAAAAASTRITRRRLVAGTMLAALVPLFAVFTTQPGTPAYFATVVLAGGLAHAALPLMIITVQDLAAYALATASGLMGFALGVAGVLYAGVGQLQELLGLIPATSLAYLTMLPAAAVALVVLRRHPAVAGVTDGVSMSAQCRCSPCLCATCSSSILENLTR